MDLCGVSDKKAACMRMDDASIIDYNEGPYNESGLLLWIKVGMPHYLNAPHLLAMLQLYSRYALKQRYTLLCDSQLTTVYTPFTVSGSQMI